MIRRLHPWLIAFLLLFAQQAAQWHALSHVQDAEKGIPHPAAQCLAFHAVDSVLPCGKVALDPPRVQPLPPILAALPPSRAPRIEFDSRAPPILS
jgi:hypothetical protein